MKKLMIAVVLFSCMALAASANAQSKIHFGIGADIGLPIGTFGDSQGIGIGGTAKVYYPFNDMVTFTGTAGYMTFSGKDVTTAGVTVKAGSWNMIPVVVGARYYFAPASSNFRPYGAFDIGMIFGSYTVPSQTFFGVTVGGGSVSTSDFTYQPMLGFVASNWDIALRLIGVSGANNLAARIGYIFN
jgi:hypothetical protein